MYKKHILSILAIILMVWTVSLFIVETYHSKDPIVTNAQSFSPEAYNIPAYKNILYRPLVALDSLWANPDNDPDGPAAIAFIFFPMLALLLSGIDAILSTRRKAKDRFALYVFLASIATPILILIIQGIYSSITT